MDWIKTVTSPGRESRIIRVAALAVVGLFLLQVGLILVRHGNYFWDFDVYFTAASALWSGENPYAATHPDHPFRYVYPLLSLLLFVPLLPFGAIAAPVIHFAFQLLVLALLWNHLRKEYVDESKQALFAMFFLLAFNSCLSAGLRAGNVAILESALVWMAILFFLRERFVPFAALIVVSACFKIVTIAYLGLLVFSPNRPRWGVLFGGAIGYALIVGVPMVVFPEWRIQMVENITLLGDASRGALNPSLREFCEDLSELSGIANLYPGLVAIVSAVTAWKLFKSDDPKFKVMLYVLALCFVLPRMKDYSYTVLILPVFFTFDQISSRTLRITLLAIAMIPARYVTRYVFGIPDEEALRSVPFLFWEYTPLLLLAAAWTCQVVLPAHSMQASGEHASGKQLVTEAPGAEREASRS